MYILNVMNNIFSRARGDIIPFLSRIKKASPKTRFKNLGKNLVFTNFCLKPEISHSLIQFGVAVNMELKTGFFQAQGKNLVCNSL